MLLGPCLAALLGACPPLRSGQTIRHENSGSAANCVLVDVAPGEATQVIVSQPEDIEIRLRNGETSGVADGFDFGSETMTIVTPGQNYVEVRQAASSGKGRLSFVMSRTPLPLPRALVLHEAEILATNSKRSAQIVDIRDSLASWQAIGDRSAIARTWLKLGDAMLGASEFEPAREAYEKARELCRDDSDVRCSAEAANNSGFTAQQLGLFDESLARLNEASAEWKSLGDALKEGQTLSNMGLLYRQTGDYQRALSLYDRAGRTLPKGAALAHAIVLNNLGFCYQFLAEYDTARLYFERALTAESALPGGARDAVRARLNLGHNFLLQGNTVKAISILERAVTDATALRDRTATANALNNLGQALLSAGRANEAEDRLQQALGLHRAAGDNRLVASDLHNLGLAAWNRGQPDAARERLTQALALRKQRLFRDAAAESLYSLARLERESGNLAEARDFAEEALSLLESLRTEVPGAALRASFYARKRSVFDLLVELAMVQQNGHGAEAGLLAAERGHGRALLDMLAEGALVRSLPVELLNRRSAIQKRIDLLSVQLTGSTAEREHVLLQQIGLLVAEDQTVEADIREEFAGITPAATLASVQELQAELPSDSALLEFHLGRERSYLWLVYPADIQVFLLPARADIEAQARLAADLFGNILERRRSPEKQAAFQRALRSLSRSLLGPLSGRSLPNRLIIVPDGILGRVPFAALNLPSATGGIGLTRDLIQIPAASYLRAGKVPRPVSSFPKALLAVADPVFSLRDPRAAALASPAVATTNYRADLARLPFAGEIETAASLIPGFRRTTLSGFNASVAGLGKLSLKDYAVLHFSTHALIEDRIPELSRIALSMLDRSGRPVNGLLRPYQLAEFGLNGSTVVLSACDTALGKEVLGEGLAGLTASLFHAGASQLLLTLTEIDAEGSSEFLSKVYGNFFSPAQVSMEHSLTLARRALARSERWSDPYYWASFVLYGRPYPL